LNLGSIQAMALDEAHGRLYVTTNTNLGLATGPLGRSAIDVDPTSSTFHQVVGQVPAPGVGIFPG
jgi:hypothetical protein